MANTTFDMSGMQANLPFDETTFVGVTCMETKMVMQPVTLFSGTSPYVYEDNLISTYKFIS